MEWAPEKEKNGKEREEFVDDIPGSAAAAGSAATSASSAVAGCTAPCKRCQTPISSPLPPPTGCTAPCSRPGTTNLRLVDHLCCCKPTGKIRDIGIKLVLNSAKAIGCIVVNVGAKNLIEGRALYCPSSKKDGYTGAVESALLGLH